MIIMILTTAIILNIGLHRYSVSIREKETTISKIEMQIHKLSMLESDVGSEKTVNKKVIGELRDNGSLVKGQIDSLEKQFGPDKDIEAIGISFNNYYESVDLMFDLISNGDYNRAKVLDKQKVAPAFERLDSLVNTSSKKIAAHSKASLDFSFIGYLSITGLAFILIFLLTTHLQKTRRALIITDLAYSQIKYIFDNSAEGICIVDRNFNIIRSNDTFEKQFGPSLDKKCYELYGTQLCNTENCPMNAIIKGKNRVENQIEKINPDGTSSYYSVTAGPYFDANGKIRGIVKNFRDVTEQRKSAEVLNRYRLFSQRTRDIILFLRKDGQIIEANVAASKIYGYSNEELLRLNIADLRAPETFAVIQYQMDLADKKGIMFETLHKTKNGLVFPVEVSSAGADFGNERILVSIIRDIRERKRAEKMISDQKEFSENLIHNLAIPAFVLDPNHRVMIWNRACEVLSGIRAEEVLQTDKHWMAFYESRQYCLADVIIEGCISKLPAGYTKLEKSSINSVGLHAESWFENFGGKKRYITIEAVPIYDSGKNLVAVIETLQDITALKNSEEAVITYNNRIRQELELASKVQQSMLPENPPNIPNVDFFWKYEPSVYLGGDMFNVFPLANDTIGFYILDVKGHGIGAALDAVTLNNLLRPDHQGKRLGDSANNKYLEPSKILTRLNENDAPVSKNFFTIFYGILNTQTMEMRYARAGHCPPVIASRCGSTKLLTEGSIAIGMLKNVTYNDYTVQLKSGDKVLLFTDGVLETEDSNEPFLLEDLAGLIGANYDCPISKLVNNIVEETKNRTQNLDVRDDITLVGIEIK